MIKLNIQVLNSNGDELVDKMLTYESLEEMGNVESLAYDLMNEANKNAELDNTPTE